MGTEEEEEEGEYSQGIECSRVEDCLEHTLCWCGWWWGWRWLQCTINNGQLCGWDGMGWGRWLDEVTQNRVINIIVIPLTMRLHWNKYTHVQQLHLSLPPGSSPHNPNSIPISCICTASASAHALDDWMNDVWTCESIKQGSQGIIKCSTLLDCYYYVLCYFALQE